ncbi:MAG: hypothetical protein WDO14_18135 [Bacteroidota bacterium]
MQKIRRRTLRLAAMVVILFAGLNVHAQSDQEKLDKVAIPQMLPATPEVTAFMKVGFGTANMSTGAASTNIPLYTIKLKDFQFPISLSYSTQGLKADEFSSRVGLGWALNANGMLSRSVHGIPDEWGTRENPPVTFPDNSNLPNDTVVTFYEKGADPTMSGVDMQVDEFNYHMNGHTGSFVLDDDYEPALTTANNDVIIMAVVNGSGGGISITTITTADGVKYTFQTTEKTTTSDIGSTGTVTAWFLDRIDLPNGDNIVFHYTSLEYSVPTGTTETIIVPKMDSGYPAVSPPVSKQDNVGYFTYYLDSITVSNGTVVDFTYNYSMLLTNLDVAGQKHFEFNYGHNTAGTRSFLTEISDVTGDPLSYHFEYDRMSDVPSPILCSQDYLGFFNGGLRKPMIPTDLVFDEYFDPSEFSPPSTDAAKLGTLIKITYPTSGTEEFIYEGNTEAKEVIRAGEIVNVLVEGPGGGLAGSYEPLTYWRHDINIEVDQPVSLTAWASDAAADYPAEAGISVPNVKVWFYDETDSIEMGSFSSTGLEHRVQSVTFTLLAGHTYGIKMIAEHYTEISHVTMSYRIHEFPLTDKVNVTAPGVRLKQIKYTDLIRGSGYSKFYTYSTLDELNVSTGGVLKPSYASESYVMIYPVNPTTGGTLYYRTIYSTSTAKQLYALYNTPVYYNTVIESDDPDLENGGTEYTFYPPDQGSAIGLVKGNGVPAGGGQFPTLTGVVRLQRVFNNEHEIVQTEETVYESPSDISGMPKSYVVRKNFHTDGPDVSTPINFDATQVFYAKYWNRIKKKTTTSFAVGTSFTQETTYQYMSNNIQPYRITVTDSKSGTWQTQLRYANTMPGADPAHSGYENLSTVNRVAMPVYKALYHNEELQQEQKTIYATWSSFVLEPQKIQVRQSPTDVLHDEIIYLDYDKVGHPRSLKKRNDFVIAYLWDSIQNVPIAEVKNAVASQVAFTSFENNALGSWKTTGTLRTTVGFTGTTSFKGLLTRKVVGSSTYIVSLWVQGNAPSIKINDIGISKTAKATIDGWTLYEASFTVVGDDEASVKIETDSTSYIDEVRLHPSGAQMISLTYKPFIGVSTQSDPNQRVSFYEYDTSNRLSLIRDQERNIIKTFNYSYQQH